MAIKLKNTNSMEDLAIHYEFTENQELAEKYYLMAIELKHVNAMYNFADYYRCKDDFVNMEKYFVMATEYNDIDAVYDLLEYYKKTNNEEKIKIYVLKAFELQSKNNPIGNSELYEKISVSLFTILSILKSVENPTPTITEHINNLLKSNEITKYNNKIRLFTQLNNIVDCPICFENRLNIDLNCGHCFCTDCYTKILDRCCPLCRM